MSWLAGWVCSVLLLCSFSMSNPSLLDEAKAYLKYLDQALCDYKHRLTLAEWNYRTNLSEENFNKKIEVTNLVKNIKYLNFPWNEFNDTDVLRQAEKYGFLKTKNISAINQQSYTDLNYIQSKMIDVYSSESVCEFRNRSRCGLSLKPDLRGIFKTSDNVEELKYYWLTFQNQVSRDIKPLYTRYVELSNEVASFSNFANTADQWLDEYEGPRVQEYEQHVESLYNQFRPFYLHLHAFVRKRLFDYYGAQIINRTGPIPIHLTGSINGETFLLDVDKFKIKPYPKTDSTDITQKLKQQKYTPTKMAAICDDFYQSLGLPAMPDSFWNDSLFEKPKDRITTCFTSAVDFCNKEDYRLMMCAETNMHDFLTLCHEMGHLQYSIGFKDQPCCYREPNKGINEAVADIAGLSVSTTSRLHALGLLDGGNVDQEVEINKLFLTALDKFALLPYCLVVDLWRWRYFQGKIDESNANKLWWNLRLEYQGLIAPEPRPDDGLDPASKSHVVDGSQYIMYFMAHIIQFQMQEALCIAAGKYNTTSPATPPLSQCDIYGSQEAGQLMRNMFAIGNSKRWPEALEAITGQRDIDARPILKYFDPLYQWLIKENDRTGEAIGW